MLIKLFKMLLLCGTIFIGIKPYLNVKALEDESILNTVNAIHTKEVNFYAMDYKSPEVKSIKLNKNIAEPGEVIKLSLEVIDDFSDIGTVQVVYQKPISKNSTSLFLKYNSDTGLYEAEILVDETMEAGEWKIDFIFVCDTQDNSDWIYNTNINLANEGRDLSQGNFSIKGTEGTSDYKSPEVKSIKLNKNIARPGEVIKLTLEVVDDFSDIGTVQVVYQKPISKNSTSLFLKYNSDTGLYETEILVDEAMEAGEWKINFIFVCDTQDNSKWIYNTNISPVNEGRDLSQGNFSIKGTEGTSDYKSPEVKSIKLNKNVAIPGEVIKLSLEVIDDFSDIGTVQVVYQKPISKNSINLFLEYNSDTGLYEAEILVDEAMEAGEWKIDFIFVCDTQDNSDWIYNTNINPANEGRDLSQGDFIILSHHKLGWLQEGDKWYYLKEDGKFLTGWLQEGDIWYYLKSSGAMVTGWERVNGTWYYFNPSGKMVTGWLQERNTWYYLKSNGAMATGWEKINGTWYYFNPSGKMVTGWLQEGNTWYYLKSSGAMAIGWEKIQGTWYYFNLSGKMQTGWLQEGNTWYYLKSSGAMAIGWEKVQGTWYYFNPSGKMQTGWLQEGNTWYYLKTSGAMATGWEKVNGIWYYFYSSGRMATNTVIDGWKITSSGKAYKL